MSSPTMPSSGSRLTSGQQISARSQYGPTIGTTSSATNRRTVMKRSHCSSVNWSRTKKKSVPSDSPRCSLVVACVMAGLRVEIITIEERLDHGGQASGVGGQLKMAARINVQLAARDQPVHDAAVDQRDDGVVVTGQDQRGRLQPAQTRQAGPAPRGQQLVVVAPGRAQT